MIALVFALCAASAAECGGPCGEDAACAREVAACQMEAGQPRAALTVLKEASRAHPDDGDLVRRMAEAYLASGNSVWATRRLLERVAAAPDDLETRTWALWVLLQDGDVGRARQLVAEEVDAADGPLQARAVLLAAALDHLDGEPASAREQLVAVQREADSLFAEDHALQRDLRAKVLGDTRDPLSLRLLATAGYSSNVSNSSPQEVGSLGEASRAPIAMLDGVARVEPWTSMGARPLAEGRVKGLAPLLSEAASFAYLDLAGRVGVEIGRADGLRGRVLYSAEILGVNSSDEYTTSAQRWFMEAHRADVEVDLLPQVQVFAGAGRRIYRSVGHSRTEVDLGVAGVLPLQGGWNLTGILTARHQDAFHPDWDLWGTTVLVRAVAPLPAGGMLKARAMVLHDVYPDHQLDRRDWMVRAAVGPWTGPVHGWRFGLSYAVANRWSSGAWSSEDDPFSYAAPDHRLLVEARWQVTRDPWGPTVGDAGDEHLAPPYGIGAADDSGLDRVQDLLRQEDSARRGSTCVD